MLAEVKIPEIGENITKGVVVKIAVKVGDAVTKGQKLIDLESEKATAEIPSLQDGTVKEILVKEGQEVKVGQVIIKIESGAKTGAPQAPAPRMETAAAQKAPVKKETPLVKEAVKTLISESVSSFHPHQASAARADVLAAPSVRRFAREIGIDVAHVEGTGPKGRISVEDVKAYSKRINTGMAVRPQGSASLPSLPDFSKWGEVERKPMSQIRKKTAEHLSMAWSTIPHVTQFDKTDITELEKLRKKYSKPERKLTVTPFILKVMASALSNFPQFNASVDMATSEIIYKKYIHIGVAVDTERGLLVPVIRHVNKKSISEITDELTVMSEKARNGKLSIDEMKGGSMSLTNLGSIGGTSFTPIVNWPEVAILGVSRAQKEMVVNEHDMSPRLMLPLSLSYDHRLIDGADGARFLRWVCDAIQQPFLLEI